MKTLKLRQEQLETLEKELEMAERMETLYGSTISELLVIAKNVEIKGRHSMAKSFLIEAIMAAEETSKVEQKRVQDIVREVAITWPTLSIVEDVTSVLHSHVSADYAVEKNESSCCNYDLVESAKCVEEVATKLKVEEVTNATVDQQDKDKYIKGITSGSMIAVRLLGGRVLSGMIYAFDHASNVYAIETKDGTHYAVCKKNILWVKTGSRWPKWVYLAFKGAVIDSEYKRIDQANV